MKSITTAILFLALILLITGCAKAPVCGNGEIEEGENMENCCKDVGCTGDQECVENKCVEPGCTGCTYLDEAKHKCVEYECCSDEDCTEGQTCIDHKCKEKSCGECEYLDGDSCKKYVCCKDDDCDDNDESTEDECKYGGTRSAECKHTSLNECEEDIDCNDNNISTLDSCSISEPRKCRHVLITRCTDDDDYCPPGCDYNDDNDCEKNVTECNEDDIDCFYDALQDNCHLAKLTWTVKDEANSSIDKEITTYFVIEGKDNDNKCKVYLKTKEVKLEFTDDYKDDLEALNYTASEIDDMESDLQNEADNVEGYDLTCRFEDIGDMIDILNEWEDGDYTTETYEDYCTGDYFD